MQLQISKHQRSKMVIMTDEARVLRRLRQEAGLSLRQVGERLGRNHSTVSHIEMGRMDPPTGDRLLEMLAIYGVDTHKSFYDRVRNYQKKQTPEEELKELLDRLGKDKAAIVLKIAKRIAEGKAVLSY